MRARSSPRADASLRVLPCVFCACASVCVCALDGARRRKLWSVNGQSDRGRRRGGRGAAWRGVGRALRRGAASARDGGGAQRQQLSTLSRAHRHTHTCTCRRHAAEHGAIYYCSRRAATATTARHPKHTVMKRTMTIMSGAWSGIHTHTLHRFTRASLHTICQSMASPPAAASASLVLLKCRQPKKPRCADRPEGCGASRTVHSRASPARRAARRAPSPARACPTAGKPAAAAAAAAAVPLRPPRSTRRARPAPPPSLRCRRRFTARHPRRAVSHAHAVCGAQHVRAYPLLSTPRAAAPSRGRLPTPLLCLCAPARRWPAPASATVPAQCCGRNGPTVWGRRTRWKLRGSRARVRF